MNKPLAYFSAALKRCLSLDELKAGGKNFAVGAAYDKDSVNLANLKRLVSACNIFCKWYAVSFKANRQFFKHTDGLSLLCLSGYFYEENGDVAGGIDIVAKQDDFDNQALASLNVWFN